MIDDVEHILISEQEIQQRVQELAGQIEADYAGKDLLMVGLLKGAVTFMVDLARAMDRPVAVDFMAVSSYGASTESSGVVRFLKDLDESIEGKHVLVIEDIVDSGLTLQYILEILRQRKPASLRVCVLLDKKERRQVDIPMHYVGFTVPDAFVVGYGLDFDQIYRNLPFVGVLKPEIYESTLPDASSSAEAG
ncbi:MAG: hypoxanthine phosphoribosyltransferase [Chloroflexia bacterium]|nr:hypoxanthine phosphoribosyltransferase [Chloroflexia bacterium]